MYLFSFKRPWMKFPLFALVCVVAAGVYCQRYAQQDATPPYLKPPFTSFSRGEAVAVAMREWIMWGQPVFGEALVEDDTTFELDDTIPERAQANWQRVGDYMYEGAGRLVGTGKHDQYGAVLAPRNYPAYSWSAAFISYVMKQAGGTGGFVFSNEHLVYINAAAMQAYGKRSDLAIVAMDPAKYAPQLGDLVCFTKNSPAFNFEDLPTLNQYYAHCNIVVNRAGDVLSVIGGNVHNRVAMMPVRVNAKGLLPPQENEAADGHHWFVVIRVLYKTN